MTEPAVRDALRHVIDPELGINIVDLGLVYDIAIDGTRVRVEMTMTSPACPLGGYLKDLVDSTIKWRVPASRTSTSRSCGIRPGIPVGSRMLRNVNSMEDCDE